MTTKEKILDAALTMFSQRGYHAVSIRDICHEVGIKESSVYYHFKNKQDILDSLFVKFERRVNDLIMPLRSQDAWSVRTPSFEWVDTYFFDQYLLDPFCNRMMRLMLLEQLHDEGIRDRYERWLFTEPHAIEVSVFEELARLGLMDMDAAKRAGRDFNAQMTTLTFKYLLNGELTTQRKEAFLREAHDFIDGRFGYLRG